MEMEIDTYSNDVTITQTTGFYLLTGLPRASYKTYVMVSSSINQDNPHSYFIGLL